MIELVCQLQLLTVNFMCLKVHHIDHRPLTLIKTQKKETTDLFDNRLQGLTVICHVLVQEICYKMQKTYILYCRLMISSIM